MNSKLIFTRSIMKTGVMYMRAKNIGMIFLVIALILALPAHSIAQTTWQDHCSSTTGWQDSDTWTGWTAWDVVPGVLSSGGDYLYTDTGSTENDGPFWWKDIGYDTNLNAFSNFTVEFYVDQTLEQSRGHFCIALFDSNQDVVMYFQIGDSFVLTRSLIASVTYVFKNDTIQQVLTPNISSDSVQSFFTISQENDVLYTRLLGASITQLLSSGQVLSEQSRIIRYIGIQWNNPDSFPLAFQLENILFSGAELSTAPVVVPLKLILTLGVIIGGIIVLMVLRKHSKSKAFAKQYGGVYEWILGLYFAAVAFMIYAETISLNSPIEFLSSLGLVLGVVTLLVACLFCSGRWKIVTKTPETPNVSDNG